MQTLGLVMLLAFFAGFALVAFWAFGWLRKEQAEAHARIPLIEDDGHD